MMSAGSRKKLSNPNISAKERGLIKGAIRRVFSRSDLRKAVIEASIIEGYTDETRKRVKTWCECALCGKREAKSNMECDHIDPIIPLETSLEQMNWDTVINRIWCEKN